MGSELFDCLASTRELYSQASGEATGGVFLYGAGFVGKWSVNYLEDSGVPVLGFVDSNEAKWGTSVSGKRVFGPNDPMVLKAGVILVTSRHAVPVIKKNLRHLPAVVMSIDAFVVHAEGNEAIEQIESLFAHNQFSMETFHAILLSMLQGDTRPLAPFANSKPFFDQFGFYTRDAEIFVDAGAYVGDSLERFIWSVNGMFKHIHAFEPGEVQFAAMQYRVRRLVSEWALDPACISLVNKGISSISGVAHVVSEGELIRTRLEEGHANAESSKALEISTVSLDDYFSDGEYTLLKVDVEGSESELLAGATQSIRRFRPRIALSVYHFPTDIFELPLQCKSANSDYVFTLGHHSSLLVDTVLYCRDRDD